jgi:hypothetical protein
LITSPLQSVDPDVLGQILAALAAPFKRNAVQA